MNDGNSLQERLVDSIRSENISDVKECIDMGAIESHDSSFGGIGKICPLHEAVKVKSYDLINILVSHGADINETTFGRETALSIASLKLKDPKLVRYLVEMGADVNTRYLNGPLVAHLSYHASIEGKFPLCSEQLEILEYLIQSGFNRKSKSGDCPNSLYEGPIEAGDIPALEVLFRNKISRNQPSTFRAFRKAVIDGNVEVVEYLLNNRFKTMPTKKQEGYPYDLIYQAVGSGSLEMVKLFIKHGSSLERVITNGGVRDPLVFKAVKNKTSDILELLIASGAPVDDVGAVVCKESNANTIHYHTALMLASSLNDCESIQLLLNAGANINRVCSYGKANFDRDPVFENVSALDMANRVQAKQAIDLLISFGGESESALRT